MQAESDTITFESGDDGVVCGDVLISGLVRVDAQLLPLASPLLVSEVEDIPDGVDLDYGTPSSTRALTSWWTISARSLRASAWEG